MLAGLNPAQGLIFMLQALGGGLISVDMAMRELPFGINVTQEQEKIEVEGMRKALVSSMQSYAQAIPQMAMQGQDPTKIVQQFAEVIKARKAGKPIEEAIEAVFTPEEPPAGAQPTVEQPVPAAPGAPVGGAQPQLPPQDQMQTLLARLSGGGQASSSVQTEQRRPI